MKRLLITGSPAYHSSATANAPYGNTLRSSSPGSGGGVSNGGAGGSHVTLNIAKVQFYLIYVSCMKKKTSFMYCIFDLSC